LAGLSLLTFSGEIATSDPLAVKSGLGDGIGVTAIRVGAGETGDDAAGVRLARLVRLGVARMIFVGMATLCVRELFPASGTSPWHAEQANRISKPKVIAR
jgi:hypothetical protein